MPISSPVGQSATWLADSVGGRKMNQRIADTIGGIILGVAGLWIYLYLLAPYFYHR